MTLRALFPCAAALALLAAPPALAQPRPEDVPDPVRPEEIQAFVARLWEEAPEATLEVPGLLRLTYKQVPADPADAALRFTRQLPNNQMARGVTPEVFSRQFVPRVAQCLAERMVEVGRLEALVELEVQRKRIPTGDPHKVGLTYDDEGRPAALVFHGDALRRAVQIPLRLAPAEQGGPERLTFSVHEPDELEEGQEELRLMVGFSAALRGLTRQAIERAE